MRTKFDLTNANVRVKRKKELFFFFLMLNRLILRFIWVLRLIFLCGSNEKPLRLFAILETKEELREIIEFRRLKLGKRIESFACHIKQICHKAYLNDYSVLFVNMLIKI